jgi:hypothetical protein
MPSDTTITGGPPGTTADTSATFFLDSNVPGSAFECNLDGGGFTPCTSPQTYNGLSDGPHTFQARAIDFVSNVDYTPATHNWTVDTTSPSAGLITNIQVGSGKTYEVDTLEVGKLTYSDRSYTFTSVPSGYPGQEFIRTANNDKNATTANFLSFDLTASAKVRVLLDNRVSTLPAWLDDGSWTLLTDIVGTSDVNRRVYEKEFSAGTVQLGGNAMSPMSGAQSNYNVVVIPTGS